jgi:hypothetical protein
LSKAEIDPPSPLRPNLQDWAPAIILCLATAVLFRQLLLGEVIFWGVPLLQFYPWHEMASSALRAGRLPLWNPLAGCGAPLLANYQTAVFYPPNWLYLIIPAEYAMGLVGMVHLIWAGLGMRAYLRRLGVDRLGQGVGAISFALSGYLVSRFGFLSITSTVPWLPWLMWAVDGVVEAGGKRSLRRAFSLLAGVVAMMLLAGHAQTAFYSLILAGAYGLWRVLARPAGSDSRMKGAVLAWMLAAVALGAAVAAVQLVPTFELMQASQRAGGVEREFALTYSFWPWRFLSLIAPDLFGSPARGDWWGYGMYWEDAIYVGLLTLLLAVRGVVRWLRERRTAPPAVQAVPFFAVSLIPVVILALGKNTPLFPFLYDHVPTFNMFQAPTRWMVLAVFALCVLGAAGADRFVVSERGMFWSRLSLAGGAAVVPIALVVSRGVSEGVRPSLPDALIRLGIQVALMALLFLTWERAEKLARGRPMWETAALVLLALDLISAHGGLNPTLPASYYHQPSGLAETVAATAPGTRTLYLPEDAYQAEFEALLDVSNFHAGGRTRWDELRASLLPNLGLIDGVPSANNFDPLRVGPQDALIEALRGVRLSEAIESARRMGVGVLLAPRDLPGMGQIGRAGEIRAYRVPDPWPRVALADCAESESGLGCRPRSNGVARIMTDMPERLAVHVEAEQAGYLLLLDTYYPGWTVKLDGQAVPLLQANGAFRAVQVPAGEHEIIFAYQPVSLLVGAAISGVGLLALAGLGLSIRRSI